MRLFALLLVLPFAACGGSSPQTPPPAETAVESGGEETHIHEAEDVDDEFVEEVEAEPSGPGELHAVIRMGGEDQEGTLSVQDVRGDTIAEGRSGDTLTLPSGSYRVVGTIDAPEGHGSLYGSRTEDIRVVPGDTTEVSLRYEVARIRINVRRNGRAVGRWRMTLTREGSEGEITLTPSSEHVTVPPGRYSGVLHAGARRIEVSGLLFQGGATMDVPVNVE